MKNIIDYFKSNKNNKNGKDRKENETKVFNYKQVSKESPIDERQRLAKLHPAIVVNELANRIQGIASIIKKNNGGITPIVIKYINGKPYSFAYFRSTRSFSIYEIKAEDDPNGKKIISRKTIVGIQMAINDIADNKI